MDYKIQQSQNNHSVQNLNNSHVLTHNFGNIDVIRTQYMVPGDKMKFDVSALTRLLPLPCPTYSNVRMILRGFFVPFDFVVRDFSHFLANDSLVTSAGLKIGAIPYTTAYDVMCAFEALDLMTFYVPEDNEKPDFVFCYNDPGEQGSGSPAAYLYAKLSPIGRRVRNLLLQLGIKLPHLYHAHNHTAYGDTLEKMSVEKISLLPLLSFLKFYTDWVVPARFVQTNFSTILGYLDRHYFAGSCVFGASDESTVLTGYDWTLNYNFSLTDLLSVLPAVSFLNDDYFTSAFKTAYGTENSTGVLVQGLKVLGTGTYSNSLKNPDSNPAGFDGEANLNYQSPLTQLQLLSLGRLQDMVNRKKITDYHVLEWLKVTYGVTESKDALHYSSYLGAKVSDIRIGDIMATASTDSSFGSTAVGQYAGKGAGAIESADWSFESDKHGLFFITCELQTKTSYVQGLDPFVKCLNREDFFLPEFDNVGVRAIAHRELIYDVFDVNYLTEIDATQVPAPDAVFGFAPRYSEFKKVDDMISGDFANPSVNTGLDSWYLSRKYTLTDNPVISLDFCSASNRSVGSQYDRIFQNTSDIDHFYSVFQVNCRADRPMQSISEYFEDLTDDGGKVQDVNNNNELG